MKFRLSLRNLLPLHFSIIVVALLALHPTSAKSETAGLQKSQSQKSQTVAGEKDIPSEETARASLYEVRVELKDDTDVTKFPVKDLKHFQFQTEEMLAEISAQLHRILGYQPKQRLVVRLLSPEQFVDKSGSASWMGALYYNQQISLPLRPGLLRSASRLRRTLTHEYVHAASGELSGHHAPAWFEEGLAQMLEGPVNPALAPALLSRLKGQGPFSLASLDSGFGAMPSEEVPAAYAQSLFAVRSLVNRFGFQSVRNYFSLLKAGHEPDVSFSLAFNVPLKAFHDDVCIQLVRWSAAGGQKL